MLGWKPTNLAQLLHALASPAPEAAAKKILILAQVSSCGQFQSNISVKQNAYPLPMPGVHHQVKVPTYTTHYSSTNCVKWYGMAVHKGVFPNSHLGKFQIKGALATLLLLLLLNWAV